MAVAAEPEPGPIVTVAAERGREPEERFRPARGRSRWAAGALLAGFSVLFLIPFLWLVSASLRPFGQTFSGQLLPTAFTWQNYVEVFQVTEFARWAGNSVLVSLLGAVLVVFSSAFVAFGFTYARFPGREAVFAVVLATMMLPAAVTMIPTFLIWHQIGLVDTLVPLFGANLFGSAFYIFLLRQFFLGLPRDLYEAARVDGAGPLRIWWSIVLPLSRPALIAVGIFEFNAKWTDFMAPLIYLQNQHLFTIPLGLKVLNDEFGRGGGTNHPEVIMAGSVLMTIPMIVIFFLMQRYFVRGIATTGLKG
jgi:multiple sugar transport system permease protein